MPPLVLADLAANLSPRAALWVSINPDAVWDLRAMLLAQQIDAFATFVWALGGKKGPQPEPIPRPGVKPDVQVIGDGDGFDSLDDFRAWYSARQAEMVPATG